MATEAFYETTAAWADLVGVTAALGNADVSLVFRATANDRNALCEIVTGGASAPGATINGLLIQHGDEVRCRSDHIWVRNLIGGGRIVPNVL